MESPITKTAPQSNSFFIRDVFKKCPEDRKESNQGEDHRVFVDKMKPNLVINQFPKDLLPSSSAFLPSSPALKSSAKKSQKGWKETADAYVFKLDLSGVKKHEVKLKIEDNGVLCITKFMAEREETDIWSLAKGKSRRFYQRIESPDDADVDKVRAEINNGKLIITVPKYQFRKPKPRVVQISGR